MWQMADRCRDGIVLVIVQDDGDGPDQRSDGYQPIHRLRGRAAGGGNDVVGVFQQMIRGILEACLFRSGHGMASDKTVLHPEPGDRLVDVGLGASHVGDDGARL